MIILFGLLTAEFVAVYAEEPRSKHHRSAELIPILLNRSEPAGTRGNYSTLLISLAKIGVPI